MKAVAMHETHTKGSVFIDYVIHTSLKYTYTWDLFAYDTVSM